MSSIAQDFLDLHRPDPPLLLPNPWDIGSAKILAAMGFAALATTSGGFAASLGRIDRRVTRDEAIAHAAQIGAATGLPIHGDFENGFADDAAGVAQTIALAVAAGVAACSIEDSADDGTLYEAGHAAERIAAAAEVAHGGPVRLALTARAENFMHPDADIGETIARLQAYQEAGADVLHAPALRRIEDIRAVVQSVDRPVNVLVVPGLPPVSELAGAGVSRISTGSAFAISSYVGLVGAAEELRDSGTYGFSIGLRGVYEDLMRGAFEDPPPTS